MREQSDFKDEQLIAYNNINKQLDATMIAY